MKNLNLNLNAASLKLSEEKKKQIVAVIIKNGRLFLVIFIGSVAVYSFNVIYKKAYIDINFVQFNPVTAKISSDNETLEDVIKDIEARQDNLKVIDEKKYEDPFSFRDSAKSGQEDTQDTGAVDTSGSEGDAQVPADSAAARRIR